MNCVVCKYVVPSSLFDEKEVRYIVHDAAANEVDQHTFFHLRESGGTKISSAYELALQMIRDKYPTAEWNVYPFHFSDGDNWSTRDTEHCVGLLKDSLLPMSNQFCYGQVKSAYGSGQFKKDLDGAFRGDEKVVTTDIPDRDGILPSIISHTATRKVSCRIISLYLLASPPVRSCSETELIKAK